MKKLVLVVIFLLFINSVAQAVTIDFQVLEHNDDLQTHHGTTYSEDGYTIALQPPVPGEFLATRGTQAFMYSGSTAMLYTGLENNITLTESNGNLFNLISIDLAPLTSTPPTQITFRVREKITLQSWVELSQAYGFSHLSKRLISA